MKIYSSKSWSFGIYFMTPYEDGNHNKLNINFFGWSVWFTLPEIIKPKQIWIDTSKYPWSSKNGGYWQSIQKSYGIHFTSDTIHIHYGIQPGYSSDDLKNSDHSRVFWYPWNWNYKRCTVYNLDETKQWDNTLISFKEKNEWGKIYDERYKIEDREEYWKFIPEDNVLEFTTYIDKYDGKEIPVKYYIKEYEWHRGRYFPFTLLKYFKFGKKIRKSIDIEFKNEVGSEKGTWKGGIMELNFDMKEGEFYKDTWNRFCREKEL